MKRVLCAVLLAAAASQVSAADVGIGVSVQSDDSWIYVPIDFGSSFRLEPSIRYRDASSKSVSYDEFLNSTITLTADSDTTTYELGVGLFGLKQIGDSLRVYYGGRIAYIDAKQELRFTTDFGIGDEQREEVETDGYRISPTLGFEYLFNEHFSIGAEAEWFYEDTESDRRVTDDPPSNADAEVTGTDTRLIVRFRF